MAKTGVAVHADVTPGISYLTALAAIQMLKEASCLDLTDDDFDFLTSKKLWLPGDRSRARRCVEATVYGALDFLGFPRFPAPAEFIAGAICYYVSPVNMQIACAVMDGCEFSENVINGIERTISASELFAHVLRIKAGYTGDLVSAGHLAVMSLRGK